MRCEEFTKGASTRANESAATVPLFPLEQTRRMWRDHQPKKPKQPDPNLQRDLERGWMLPYLLEIDSLLWGRWDYWTRIHVEGVLPDEPIPRIEWNDSGGSGAMGAGPGRKMLERCLESISGGWRGWSTWNELDYFLRWLLFGFGAHGSELPDEPAGAEGASMRLYQLFDLWPLLLWPYDHWADLMAETGYGKRNAFYATPHNVCEMMVQMQMSGEDCRAKTVSDPAVGSGRMLLHASNYSLRLFGQDIDGTLCKVCHVNGFLFAPWLAKPFEWDAQKRIVPSERGEFWRQMLAFQSLITGFGERAPVETVTSDVSLFQSEECAATVRETQSPSRRRTKASRATTAQLILEM